MDKANPYAAPRGEPPRTPRSRLTITRAFVVIIGSAVGFAVAGAGIGCALGFLAPDYYRLVFRAGDRAGFDPPLVGLGMGLTQGLICGLIVGAVVILAVAISKRRAQAD